MLVKREIVKKNNKDLDMWWEKVLEPDLQSLIEDLSTNRVKCIAENLILGMQRQLLLHQKRYEVLVNTTSDLVVCFSTDGKISLANQAFCRFIQKSPGEVVGSNFLDFVYEADQGGIISLLSSIPLDKPELTFSGRMVKPDGSISWQEWDTQAIFNEEGTIVELQAVGHPVSDVWQIERVLKESETYYRAIFENTGTAMMIYKYDMSIVLVNSEFEKLSGYSREEIEHRMKWTEFIHEDDLDRMINYHFQRQVDSESVPNNYEFRLRDRWGHIKNIFLTVALIGDNQTVVVSFMDITERKRMEQALLQSERKYMSILNTCPNEIAITTIEEGRFIDVNFQACKTLGLSYDEIVGHTSQELELWVNPQDRVELVNLLKQTGLVKNQEYTMWVHNGREITALVSAEIWDFDGTQCMILIINDISEKKKMENELARLEQLNLIGEMAASIGHEVRNPMTSVRGFLQLLKDKPQFELYNEYFNLMIEELDCANHIITEFLSMARHKNVDLRLSNLNAIILSAVPSIRAEVLAQNKELELQLNPIEDLMPDHNEIRQLLYNLSRNALESMAPGKKVIIKTYGKDNQVILAVKDQGSGIPKNIINKIGVPFFTTKEKGNGLGLAVSYSIAARHQGSIQLETSPSGTTFFVSFPLPEASLAGPE